MRYLPAGTAKDDTARGQGTAAPRACALVFGLTAGPAAALGSIANPSAAVSKAALTGSALSGTFDRASVRDCLKRNDPEAAMLEKL